MSPEPRLMLLTIVISYVITTFRDIGQPNQIFKIQENNGVPKQPSK